MKKAVLLFALKATTSSDRSLLKKPPVALKLLRGVLHSVAG